MINPLLTIPDAQLRLPDAVKLFSIAAALVGDRVVSGGPIHATDDACIRLVELLRAIDGMRHLFRTDGLAEDGDWTDVIAMAKARRSAAYIALIGIVPEEEAYWSEENQARIFVEASELTADKRAEIIRETLEFESRPPENPEAYAASQEELALWDSVVGDGIDAA